MNNLKRARFLNDVRNGNVVEKDFRSGGFSEFEFFDRPTRFLVNGKYANRPDLISNDFYGEQGYWWMILKFNGVCDVFTELVSGVVIDLPSINDLNRYIEKNTKK